MVGKNWENNGDNADAQLDALFRAYRSACPDPEPGVNFTPNMWARIEARENSTTIFSRWTRALVTVALAASVILGVMVSFEQPASVLPSDGTYLEALTAERAAALDPLHLDRISDLEHD